MARAETDWMVDSTTPRAGWIRMIGRRICVLARSMWQSHTFGAASLTGLIRASPGIHAAVESTI
jgi:hypothetical protein